MVKGQRTFADTGLMFCKNKMPSVRIEKWGMELSMKALILMA